MPKSIAEKMWLDHRGIRRDSSFGAADGKRLEENNGGARRLPRIRDERLTMILERMGEMVKVPRRTMVRNLRQPEGMSEELIKKCLGTILPAFRLTISYRSTRGTMWRFSTSWNR